MPRLIPEFSMWFDVPATQAPGRVEIAHIPDGEIQKISLDSVVMRTLYQKDTAPVQEANHMLGKDADLTLCAAVKSWEIFLDCDDKELPCTNPNKLLYARQGWFRPFVTECRIKVQKAFVEQQEEKRKN